ncbi:peptidase M16 [Aliidiomarina sedimenti]|uniref:Protease 3 n=1 Tax=Aliidiomarina sedimenti TaxID=1933879 RepID=A0ABY0C2U3_9GAMM|nr:insulinase family protein [Aliidiomarina sedimenti]RUO32190.1 peptidase M16 [Aliidiomarina sedimenti]
MVPENSSPSTRLEKSPNDHRQYQLTELDNGLSVLLVHDADALHSAASVAINAGHFQDPPNVQGLAHFLEHMLFMGTDTFPDPDDYPDFVDQHGGQHNAWTGTEHSNFHFDIRPQHFAPALERFSRLFIAPGFSPQWIDKELQAVESEYRMKLNDELRRLYQVHKETANPNHPFTKFSVGNAKTLVGNQDGSLQQHLQAFFKRWYHSANMTLVLVGPQSLDELHELASTYFSDVAEITRGSTAQVPESISEPLYTEAQKGVVIHVRPLKNACRMILTMPLPGINDDYPFKSTSLLAHMLGYEGPGSLCSELKTKGWITDLSAGGGISGSNFKDFNFNIQLTQRGLDNYLQVAHFIFNAIDALRQQGIEDFHYHERQQMVALSYRYQDAIRSIDLASQLSINMMHYAPEHIISGDYLMQGMNHSKLSSLLDYMRPEHCRLMLIHHSLPVNQTTSLYDTAYRAEKFSSDQLRALNHEPEQPLCQFPSPNPFIPQQVEPQPLREPSAGLPRLLASAPALQSWHLQDADFRVPKGHIYLSLVLPEATNNTLAFAHARVWCELVLDKLNERCYDAEVAGIQFNVYPQQSGISIHVSGFSQRQPELLQQIIKALTDFEFDEQRFNAIQQHLYHNWIALNRHKPINHLFTVLNQTLQRGCYIGPDLAAELKTMTASKFQHYMPEIFRQMNAIMLIHGDWPIDTAQQLTTMVTQGLGLQNRPQQGPLREVRLLEPGRDQRFHCRLPHPDNAIAYFCQGQSLNLEEKAHFLLLNQLISPGFFSELRTEQQLGYMVGTSYVPMNGRPGLLFYVQSPHASLDEMETAIRDFIRSFCEQLIEVPDAVWQSAKQSVIAQLTDRDPNLRVRAQRMWTSININDTDFSLAQAMADKVSSTQLSTLVESASSRLLTQAAALWLTCESEESQAEGRDQ